MPGSAIVRRAAPAPPRAEWPPVVRDAPRSGAPFDEARFTELLACNAATDPGGAAAHFDVTRMEVGST
jgi:hypothetical protein